MALPRLLVKTLTNTASLHLGTGDVNTSSNRTITLRGDTGAATFAGNVVMSYPGVGQIDLLKEGNIVTYRGTSTASDSLLKLRSNVGGSAVTKAEVFADSSAEVATQVAIGSLNISSNTNAGALIFAGAMRMQRTSGDSDYLWRGYQGTT